MCGICGMVSESAVEFPLKPATDSIQHRGPDDEGYHTEPGVALGHRRLSIIDLSGGGQPIYNEDGSRCIVFNGEIYNYLDLRNHLIRQGHRFTTQSDTETILHAYEEWGEACVTRLRGMFAFAIWDAPARRLFLARDRLGIKPLFYGEHGGTLYFGSEMKTILTEAAFPRNLDDLALACYFTLSYIPAPHTIFKHIRKVPPAHTLTWQGGRISLKPYWDLSFCPDRSRGEGETLEQLIDLLQEAVRIRLMSEVPLGAFLSGGIDSGAVVALMSKASAEPVNTFCIGFGGQTGGYLDERSYARMVAERYDTHHREYQVTPVVDGMVETIVRAFDEPFADDAAIPSWFVCQIARENVTVALSGLGGDEAFAGYERYLGVALNRLYGRLPLGMRQAFLPRLMDRIPERADGHYTINHMKRFVRSGALTPDRAYLGFLTILNPLLRDRFFADTNRFRPLQEACGDLMCAYFNSDQVREANDPLNRALYCDIKTYLPEDILAVTDRMSMQHALEVRVPFIDHEFLEFCATIPPKMKLNRFHKKHLLKKAARSLLPDPVIDHRKQGFVGPLTQWLKTDLKSYTQKTLSPRNLARHGLLNHRTVARILDEHFSGREIHDTLIWSMLVFQKWFEIYQ